MPPEDTIEEHGKQIDRLFEHIHEIKNENHEQRIIEVEMKADIKHIKGRIDNGMSTTITSISKDVKDLNVLIMSKIMPICEDSQFWVGKIKYAVFWVSVIAIGGGLAKLFMAQLGG